MGGLCRLMPATFLTYAIGMMALSGVPLFFSGAWTKEEILHATAHWPASHVPHYLMMAGVVLTALYMTRQVIYVFFGQRREAAEHAHESPAVMILPLIALAIGAVGLSAVLTPAWPWLDHYLTGESAAFDPGLLIQPMLFTSLALVAAGIALGWWMYRSATDPLERGLPALFQFLANRMWLDELYEHTVLAVARSAARVSDWLDRYLWDGLVRMIGAFGGSFGSLMKGVDERAINAGMDSATINARGFGSIIAKRHSGQIHSYLVAVALSLLALLLIYGWLR